MGAEIIIGAIACIICTLGSCFCLATREEQRRRSRGLPPDLCSPGAPDQMPTDELLYSLQLQEVANAQADRAVRMEAYIERQAKLAAENWLRAQNPVTQPVQGHPGVVGQVPVGRHDFLASGAPVYMGRPGCQCAHFEQYNPDTPHHGKIIYNL
jgi:hypothetical protein